MSKKMFFAVEAVLHLAYNAGADPVSGRDIAKRQGLPPRYLEQIMQQMVRAGILRGVRGPKGGYVLARERRRISIAEICEVVREMEPVEPSEFRQTALGREIAYPIIERLQAQMMRELNNLNLSTLCERAEAAGVARSKDNDVDYII